MKNLAIGILTGGMLFAQQPQGDAARGKAIFEGKGDCLSCHRVKATGSRSGPELTGIGSQRRATRAYLERALLDPDADVDRANRGVRVTLKKDGTVVTGRLLDRDMFTVELVDSQGNLKSFLKSEWSDVTIVAKGLMPSYQGKLSPQEIMDVVSYLTTLKALAP
ncbi:MAG: c-type cytochrome [Acidobacteriia bacterium]|nr:c-type cytochrome [Terriglobia bacterium]